MRVSGIEAWRAAAVDFSSRRFAAAVATGLTRTAAGARRELQAKLRAQIDSPTRYTERQLRFVAANARNLAAAVGFNIDAVTDINGRVERFEQAVEDGTPASRYLGPQMKGGSRAQKRFEKALQAVGALPAGWLAVPGQRAKLDAHGNHAVSQIRQILSYFDASELTAGSRQNMGAKGRARAKKGTKKRKGYEYAIVRPGDKSFGVKQPGIYKIVDYGDAGRFMRPIIIFVRSARYTKRYHFTEDAKSYVEAHLSAEVARAIRDSAARLRARG